MVFNARLSVLVLPTDRDEGLLVETVDYYMSGLNTEEEPPTSVIAVCVNNVHCSS